ncbi:MULTISPECIES: hypothetical protein [unclassified Microbacterium]|uniref:hypothetical protein n=1 Tax=unclassified Microbacterium TaxID=2609290 RepID=UPI001E354C00|nr:hypothetical protein [Microbacterium sp. Au-Mic1]MCE4027822.1 hypothetical protein [Microbacterium sp. Au-Mic1]
MNRYRPAADVGVIDQDDAVYVARLPQGPIVVLAGTAAVIWRAACDAGAGTVAHRAAGSVDRDSAAITDAVDGFVADLVARGLLRRAQDDPIAAPSERDP